MAECVAVIFPIEQVDNEHFPLKDLSEHS